MREIESPSSLAARGASTDPRSRRAPTTITPAGGGVHLRFAPQCALILKIIKGSYTKLGAFVGGGKGDGGKDGGKDGGGGSSAAVSRELARVVDLCLTQDHLKRPSTKELLGAPEVAYAAKAL